MREEWAKKPKRKKVGHLSNMYIHTEISQYFCKIILKEAGMM